MKYEMMFIIRPVDEHKQKSITEKVLGLVKDIGTLLKVDEWGKRVLAYEIKGETEGYYVLTEFNSEFKKVVQLDRKLHEIDEVIRHLIVWRGGEIFGDDERRKENGND